MKFLNEIKTGGALKTIGAIGLLLIGVSIFYYFVLFLPMRIAPTSNYVEIDNRFKVLEEELSKTKQELEAARNQEPKVIEKRVYVQPKQNNDLILVNFRLDVLDGENLINGLLEGSENSLSQMCPSIIAEKTTRRHTYYLVLDNIAELKSKYGQYRSSISYIDNNLAGFDGAIQIVKDKCASLGYYF